MLENKGKRIAIINACEHEFSIADNEHGGSNPLDLIQMQEDIVASREKANYVVLILHGGIELYHYPTPRMKRWYHHFIDMGADAVINHHQHCINGYEVYKGKPIFYGLGNFYFPWGANRPNSWQYGYAVQLLLNEQIGFEIVPYKQTYNGICIRNQKEFDEEIKIYNLPLLDEFLLQQKLDEYIIDQEFYIRTRLLPNFLRGRILSKIVKLISLKKLYYSDTAYAVKNRLTCESLLELIQRYFSILIK